MEYFPLQYLSGYIRQGKIPVIYVCGSSFAHFLQVMLPHINFKFILVTGDCDEDVPNEIIYNKKVFEDFLELDRLHHWFSQNLILKHKKLSHIPIGLDYHTMVNNNIWGNTMSCFEQEKLLKNFVDNNKPFYERKEMAYANFHFLMTTKHGSDRKDAFNKLTDDVVYYEKEKVSRFKTWEAQSEYAFVISPHGGGYDCHRTWEALILGCIPIVKKSAIDDLYEDLPVLIVNSWSNVNLNLLKETIDKFKKMEIDGKFNKAKLTLEYWKNKIHSI